MTLPVYRNRIGALIYKKWKVVDVEREIIYCSRATIHYTEKYAHISNKYKLMLQNNRFLRIMTSFLMTCAKWVLVISFDVT